MSGDKMRKKHIEELFNSMISDISYIKLATYSVKNKQFLFAFPTKIC